MEITKKAVFIARCFIILFILIFASCNMKTYKLLDGHARVPSDTSVYMNKTKFDISLLQVVDTTVVYEEYDMEYKILKSLDNRNGRSVYGVYRFYSNSCFNYFGLHRDEILSKEQFNPVYKGYRGVYYKENDKVRYDLFAEIDEQRHLGKISGTLTFSGDTLFVKRDDIRGLNKMTYSMEIYIKRKLPPEYFIFKANW